MRTGLLIAGMIVALPLAGQQSQATKERTESKEVHGLLQVIYVHTIEAQANGQLEIKDLRGDVAITGTDAKRIQVIEKIRIRVSDLDRAKEIAEAISGRLERIPAERPVYTFHVERSRHRNVSLFYNIKVPKVFNIFVRSFGGDIDLSELEGELNVKTGGGDIALAGTSGRITIKTAGGDIDVFKAQGRIDLVTSGGDIEGRKIEGNIIVKTGGGDIELVSIKGKLVTETGGGDIELSAFDGEKLKARTGGGDIELDHIIAEVNLMTGGGDIEVRNLVGNLEVASGGGDIELRVTAGDIVLYTHSGDIQARQIEGAIRARSGSGDIDIIGWNLANATRKESLLETRNGDVRIDLTGHTPVEVKVKVLDTPPRYGEKQIFGNIDLDISREGGNTIGWYSDSNAVHTITVETQAGAITINENEE